jgi:beta-phosphoglucomutase-like phosphatase (HAD superfamily)
LDLSGLWDGTMSPRRAAVLASRLPDGAAVWAAVGSPREWTPATYAAYGIEYNTRAAVWDPKNKNPPKPWPTPADRAAERERINVALERARRFQAGERFRAQD